MRIKRAYDEAAANDGSRVLVDRIWPRGVSRDDAGLDDWWKELAPSDALRKWFGHDPQKWPDFLDKYFNELEDHEDFITEVIDTFQESRITLVFGAKDRRHNNAVALKKYIRKKEEEKML
ncbi:MAG: DUF488 family protein [Desulfobulbaceae bacterium]|nr:DUF488 family protein [Desulfobulbaceae bacterium]